MSEPPQTSAAGPPSRLLTALEKVLRPLVRLLVSYQLTYPQLITMLKTVYVDVAEEGFRVDGKRPSDSRINLLTGVHRKDVKRLRAEPHAVSETPRSISTGARLIGHWQGDPDYLDDDGRPRPLRTRAAPGEQSEFDALVERVCRGDIRPRVILDEWLRLGVAEVRDDSVYLNTGAFTPDKGFDEKVFFFGKNIQDHIAAGSHNLLGGKPAFFDRSVYYDRLSQDSINELNQHAARLGMQALTEMNRRALALQQRDQQDSAANYRINFGIFNYNAQIPPADDNADESTGE